jgi:hypothetical protein
MHRYTVEVHGVVMDQYLKELMPTCFDYEVKSISGARSSFKAEIRVKCSNRNELLQWKTDFESKTHCKWTLRSSMPNAPTFTYRANFICDHGSYRKKATNPMNTDCQAKMALKVRTSQLFFLATVCPAG